MTFYKLNGAKRFFSAIVTSLPVWAGIIVIVLSFILWHAQRQENINEIHGMIAMQQRHLTQALERAVKYHYYKNNEDMFTDLLGSDHYYGIAIRIDENGKLIFKKGGYDPSLFKEWGLTHDIDIPDLHWRITIWPTKEILLEHKTYLPDLALFMGLIVAVLLIMVGLLAILAGQREQTIQEAHWKLRRETREKEKLQKVLQQNQKLQAVGTLAGGIAHDFNNILYAMMGYVGMCRDDVEKDSLVYQNLGKVLQAGKRGQKLISSILSFSRQQQGRDMQAMDLVDMLDHVFELLEPAIPTSVEMIRNIQLQQAEIMGDQAALEQVVVNIINNAVDAMDGRGRIEVSLEKAQFRPAYCVRVSDNGSGMTDETKERLFDPFFTTKAVDKGTGLGLSMAHGIISDHQGKILVESELGKGTTFSIYLPFLSEEIGKLNQDTDNAK